MGYDKLLLFASIFLGGAGQVLLKMGVNRIDSTGIGFFLRLAVQPWVIAGLLCYGVSTLMWLQVLKYNDISYIRPLTSLGYIVTYVLAIMMLGEGFTAKRLLATMIIVLGVFLME